MSPISCFPQTRKSLLLFKAPVHTSLIFSFGFWSETPLMLNAPIVDLWVRPSLSSGLTLHESLRFHMDPN